MSTSEIVAYLYGAKLTREAVELQSGGHGDDMPLTAWMGENEFQAIDRLGLKTFNYWMLRGGRDVLGTSDAV
jgi:hypothetical protein